MLSCQGVSVTYRQGPVRVHPLRSVQLEVGPESVVVMGPSGSGKSTLLRVLAGLQVPDRGSVAIDGVPLATGRRGGAGDPRVALVHQDYRLVEFLTVAENLLLAAELRAVPASAGDLERALDGVGLRGFGSRAPGTLSGGEQQRVAIARALVTRSQVLLADEPTGALDEENTGVVAALLRDLSRQHGMSVVVATHDRTVAGAMTRGLVLRDGRLEQAVAVSS